MTEESDDEYGIALCADDEEAGDEDADEDELQSAYTIYTGETIEIPMKESFSLGETTGVTAHKYYKKADSLVSGDSYVIAHYDQSSANRYTAGYYMLTNNSASIDGGASGLYPDHVDYTTIDDEIYIESLDTSDISEDSSYSDAFWTISGNSSTGYTLSTVTTEGNKDLIANGTNLTLGTGTGTAFTVSNITDESTFAGSYVFTYGSTYAINHYNNTVHIVAGYSYNGTPSYDVAWDLYDSDPYLYITAGDTTGDYDITVDNQTVTFHVTAADTVTSSDPANTTVNMFDYWLEERETADNKYIDNTSNAALASSGINKDAVLKYSKGGDSDSAISGEYNKNHNSNIYAGIVQSTLGDDGYPVLSEGIDPNKSSLAYLFDPDTDHDGKQSFSGVSGLFQSNSDGYYYYDSTQNYAWLDESEKKIILYDDWAVTIPDTTTSGQFFPFTPYATENDDGSCTTLTHDTDHYGMNHYFGLTMTTKFTQQNGGKSSVTGNAVKFDFQGDDDVWIFIDDVLVADIGGIHDKIKATIDFSTGDIQVGESSSAEPATISASSGTTSGYTTTLKAAFTEAGSPLASEDGYWSGNTFADGTEHTLTLFYTERGNGASNLDISFNLENNPETDLYKTDQYGDPVEGATFAAYAAEQIDGDDYAYVMASDSEDAEAAEEGTGEDENDENTTAAQTISSDELNEALASGTYTYDEDWNVVDADDKVILKAMYSNVTDEDGKFAFVSGTNIYSLRELDFLLGDCFYLREVDVPYGYRVSDPDVCLHIDEDGGKMTEVEENSNVAVSTTIRSTATTNLNLIDGDTYENTDTVGYYSINDSDSVQGTLFALVLKYVGTSNANPSSFNYSDWVPLYGTGTENDNYKAATTNITDLDSFKSAVAEALEDQCELSMANLCFTMGSDGSMQATLVNLPGDSGDYWDPENTDEDAKAPVYTIAYFWTSDNIENAAAENIYCVNAFGNSAFVQAYGAAVNFTDILNQVKIVKTDEDGKALEGASFTMYAKENESTNAQTTWTASTDGEGVIQFDDPIPSGTYYLKETEAPEGYAVNETVTKLTFSENDVAYEFITDDTDEDSGVSVEVQDDTYMVVITVSDQKESEDNQGDNDDDDDKDDDGNKIVPPNNSGDDEPDGNDKYQQDNQDNIEGDVVPDTDTPVSDSSTGDSSPVIPLIVVICAAAAAVLLI